jgi:GH24 family phage-related lysozyme (muramidase)
VGADGAPEVANVVGSAIGLDPETINQAIKGQKAFNDEMAHSRKLGVPTDEEVKKSQELQRAWFELKQAVTGDAQALLEDATPALVTILNAVAQGIEKFPKLTEAVVALAAAFVTLKSVTTGLGALRFLLGLGGAGAAAAGGGAAAAGGAGLASTVAGTAGTGVGAGAIAAGAAGVAAPVAAFLFGVGAFGKAGEADEGDKLAASRALGLIKSREGFRSKAYLDSDNRYRVGYGSDKVTDDRTGMVSDVTQRTSGVTRAMADADLSRRINTEFLPRVRKQVGAAWEKLDAATKAALLDVAYNHGSLWKDVAAAAQTGNRDQIAAAILNHQGANGGVNDGRRLQEANMVRGAQAQAAQAQRAAPGNTTVYVGDVPREHRRHRRQGYRPGRRRRRARRDGFPDQHGA